MCFYFMPVITFSKGKPCSLINGFTEVLLDWNVQSLATTAALSYSNTHSFSGSFFFFFWQRNDG